MNSKGHKQVRAKESGFTLIELLVVVLIIGILASIAIPQYFKVVERGRLAEAQTMASQIKQAQERYMVRQNIYDDTTADPNLGNLDIGFAGAGPTFGMKYFSVAVTGSAGACPGSADGYKITFTRTGTAPSRYGSYVFEYDRCCDSFYYTTCTGGAPGSCNDATGAATAGTTNCDTDFSQ